MKSILRFGLVWLAFSLTMPYARAAVYIVGAKDNSSSGGTGLSTITLSAGQHFTVSVDPNDLWSAGALPRWSNADGLTHDIFATGSDESGQAAGTKIGQSFGLWTQGGLSAPYGALVGKLGSTYFLVGTSYSGVAASSGTLQLYYWDSNSGDNSNNVQITANITAVPEPTAVLAGTLLLLPFGISTLRRFCNS